jgi:GNAT superfamily N-acetyltransferase
MLDYRLLTAPFDQGLEPELYALCLRVFGAIDGAQAAVTVFREELTWKLARMPDVTIHTARDETDTLIAFKIGYAATPARYYSWLGGVDPAHRRLGIARQLMDAQHAWARGAGYRAVETGAISTNKAMLSLNLAVGFRVIGLYDRSGEPRVVMLKELLPAAP